MLESAGSGRQERHSFPCTRNRIALERAEFPGNSHCGAVLRSKGMTKMNLKGNWNEIKGKLKQKYGQLTDDDLVFSEGKEDELLGRLQKRLGKSKEDVRREIEEF